MATCSSILAGEIPWTEEPGWLQSTVTKSHLTEHTHRKLVLQGKLNLLSLINLFWNTTMPIHLHTV